jgi:Domain of unknown function (DUF6429)
VGCAEVRVKLNERKVDESVLAVLWLTLHEECRVWKSIDWEAMDRLYEAGFISNPASRAKSVLLTEEGLAEAEKAARKLFS